MISPELFPTMTSLNPIDTAFLLKQYQPLAELRRKRLSWNDFGAGLERNFKGASRQIMTGRSRFRATAGAANWDVAKELVCDVMTGNDPEHDGIRKRLGNPQEPETARLLSTLSLWLAGVLGISVSITKPMVAVMLYAVGEAGGIGRSSGNNVDGVAQALSDGMSSAVRLPRWREFKDGSEPRRA